jgi:hypothetical protein
MTCSKFGHALVNAAITASILCFAPASFSQKGDQTQSKLLTSYGNPGASDELGAALDQLAEALRTQVSDIGYVIVYRGHNNPPRSSRRYDPPGLFHRHALAVRNYLVRAKNIESERIEVIDGGMRNRFQADIWLVPKGERPPSPSPDATGEVQEANQPTPFDEYFLVSDSDMSEYFEYFDPFARLDGFATVLASKPSTVGYIIGYAQCLDVTEGRRVDKNGVEDYVTRDYQRCDAVGTGRKIAMMEKRSLSRLFGIAPPRVSVIDGGYRNSRMVELWIVPRGGEIPRPTPTTMRKTAS